MAPTSGINSANLGLFPFSAQPAARNLISGATRIFGLGPTRASLCPHLSPQAFPRWPHLLANRVSAVPPPCLPPPFVCGRKLLKKNILPLPQLAPSQSAILIGSRSDSSSLGACRRIKLTALQENLIGLAKTDAFSAKAHSSLKRPCWTEGFGSDKPLWLLRSGFCVDCSKTKPRLGSASMMGSSSVSCRL